MRILAHIHTFNDEDVIDRSLQALLGQTYPLEEILIVDNGSTDGTLKRSFPPQVTVVRHPENLGTSGAVVTGMRYALDKGYDWIWLFDADSAPRKAALEKLIGLYRNFAPHLQAKVWLIASLPVDLATQRHYHGCMFTSKRLKEIRPDPAKLFYECDATMWTGSLYKLAAVQKIGLPAGDYVLDIGEFEYGYRGKSGGYQAFMHQSSVVDHNIVGQPSMQFKFYRFGPISFKMMELPAIRCYYLVRNLLYFWLYEYHRPNLFTLAYCFLKLAKLMIHFILRPFTHGTELSGCLRGLWDGLCKNMHHRY